MSQKSINSENLENIKFEYSLSFFDIEYIDRGLQIQLDMYKAQILAIRTKDENKNLSYDEKLELEIIEREIQDIDKLKLVIYKEIDKVRI